MTINMHPCQDSVFHTESQTSQRTSYLLFLTDELGTPTSLFQIMVVSKDKFWRRTCPNVHIHETHKKVPKSPLLLILYGFIDGPTATVAVDVAAAPMTPTRFPSTTRNPLRCVPPPARQRIGPPQSPSPTGMARHRWCLVAGVGGWSGQSTAGEEAGTLDVCRPSLGCFGATMPNR